MGVFFGIIGIGIVLWAGIVFVGGIFGSFGLMTAAAALAAGLITCGLNAYWSLRDQLNRIEEKLDALNHSIPRNE